MKIQWKKEMPALLILLCWLVAMIWVLPSAPDRLPTHMGHTGQIDTYGGKFMGLVFMPLVGIMMFAAMLVIPRFDPSFKSDPTRVAHFPGFRLIITVVLLLAHLVVLFQGLYPDLGLWPVIPAVIGVMFILVGNFLGKTRPNRMVGVRTPWTFKSKLAWVGANRFAGWALVLEGLGLVFLAIVRPEWWFWFCTGGTILVAVAAVVYSLILYRRDPDPNSPFETEEAAPGS
jgi:uncharacterized membrane protein